ncbi:MAG: TIGR04552 family protein [bacterium]|nr:TIGR04552 family protein [bacterium]
MQPLSQPQKHPMFSWDILRFMLKGDSPIDLPALAVFNRVEAQDFMRHYGYNLDDPAEATVVEEIFAEALEFIKTYFCQGTAHFPLPISVPAEFMRIDVRDLLVIASLNTERDRERQLWACAILRVMHTIHHINHEVRVDFFPEIKRQVLDNFKRNINCDEQGNPVLGSGEFAVPLRHVFYKEEKERASVILKLLQKAKNVAEKIHDRLGVKLVTHNKLDALLALRYLRQNNIVMFANVTPGRSRNSLVNLGYYKKLYDQTAVNLTSASTEEIERAFIEVAQRGEDSEASASIDEDSCFSSGTGNTFSSKDYCSLQFTVQQLVKLENPGFFTARRLRVQLERYHLGPDLEGLLKELEGPTAARERRILFPLEVQIIDYENYIKTIEGNASHADYKKRQIEAAFLRVLGPLYKYLHPSL